MAFDVKRCFSALLTTLSIINVVFACCRFWSPSKQTCSYVYTYQLPILFNMIEVVIAMPKSVVFFVKLAVLVSGRLQIFVVTLTLSWFLLSFLSLPFFPPHSLCSKLEIQTETDSAYFLETLAGNFMDVVQYNEDNRGFEVGNHRPIVFKAKIVSTVYQKYCSRKLRGTSKEQQLKKEYVSKMCLSEFLVLNRGEKNWYFLQGTFLQRISPIWLISSLESKLIKIYDVFVIKLTHCMS